MKDFGLYVIITKPRLSYEQIAEICVRRGVRMLQLREKYLSDRQLLEATKRIRSVTAGTDTCFVINDRPDIAVLADADALHIGQSDLSWDDARRIVGKDMPIGISTHSIEQAREALALSPAYIGFGPIYPTTTKAVPDPTVGTKQLSEVLRLSTVPVVAIGGIFPYNIGEITAAGARNICMVRHLMDTEHTEKRISEIQTMLCSV